MIAGAGSGGGWLLAFLLVVPREPSPPYGYRLITERPYVPAALDEEIVEQLWTVWPEPWRKRAERADGQTRRQMVFHRYGLTPRPGQSTGKPLQYVVDRSGNWYPNCFTCHGGSLLGTPWPGLPNIDYDLHRLTEDVVRVKMQTGKPLGTLDLGALMMPLSFSRGTTNAVMFGVGLGAYRNPDLSLRWFPKKRQMVHHPMDAPPWWHFRKKRRLYIDGFSPKNHRVLMQFALDRHNGPGWFRLWDSDFRHISAYLESLQAPRYPFPVDAALAEKGKWLFRQHCAHCHGTYGQEAFYPERMVAIEEVGTDRARLDALLPEYRLELQETWFCGYGQEKVQPRPGGYVAPPLDGVWASAPYFHNGSVPTLWHVLHPDRRPVVWRRSGAYDPVRVGLAVEELAEIPAAVRDPWERAWYYDTRLFGHSAAGHRFPDVLSEEEKAAVLEYLKTL